MSATNTLHFTTIGTIEKLYQPGIGRHWFDKSTSRFFRSRYPEGGYTTEDGKMTFFVTSECGPSSVRRYTVRVAIAPEDYTRRTELTNAIQHLQINEPTATEAILGHKRELANLPNDPWEIQTVEPFNELSRSVANRTARALATGKATLAYENYKYIVKD